MCNVFKYGRESDRKRKKERVNERMYARVEIQDEKKEDFVSLSYQGCRDK